jgi:transposase
VIVMSWQQQTRAARARDVALFRHALTRPLADPALTPAELGGLARELAERARVGPFGQPTTVSRASLDRWIRAGRGGGFDALTPAERQARPRAEADVLELAERLKRERPARAAARIARVIEAERGWAPSVRALRRCFARRELNTRGRRVGC